MADAKIKIKLLGEELSTSPKDMLRILRDLGIPARTSSGSVSPEEAARVRAHVAEQKQAEAGRVDSHPNVIVRRRRKESVDAPAEAPAAAVASSPEAPETEASETEAALKAGASEAAAPAPEAAAPAASASDVAAKAAAPVAEAGATASVARVVKPARATTGARVLHRPGDTPPAPAVPVAEPAAVEPEVSPAAAPAAPAAPAAKSAILAEEEASPKAVAPEAAAPKAAEESAEKAARAARLARPDASAVPEGSSAPTLPPRAPEGPL